MAVVVAIAVRYGCLAGGLDAGTANLFFVVVLAVEAVLYLLLVKSIIRFVDNRLAKRVGKKSVAETSIPAEESVHDRIVREKFEDNIALFCEYTAKVIGRHISADELGRLDIYIGSYANEQSLDKTQPIKVPSHKIGNNDLYHFGWNLWNHFRANRIDKRQECVVEWLKAVFANLEHVETATIKGKLTIHDPKGTIARQKNIPEFMRFLKE
jgi:NADH:ubiquinone oxidoreductase subunit